MNNFGLEGIAHPLCKVIMQHHATQRCTDILKGVDNPNVHGSVLISFLLKSKTTSSPKKAKFRDECIFSPFFLVWNPFWIASKQMLKHEHSVFIGVYIYFFYQFQFMLMTNIQQ